MRLLLPILAIVLGLPVAGLADVLDGQQADLRAMVILVEGASPELTSRWIKLEAGPGVELPSMQAARAALGDDISSIIEISVDLQPGSILISYADAGYGVYSDAYFSGYQFRLSGLAQFVIDQAVLDPIERLPGMVDSDLKPVPGGLWLDVGGREVAPNERIRILFPVAPLPGV